MTRRLGDTIAPLVFGFRGVLIATDIAAVLISGMFVLGFLDPVALLLSAVAVVLVGRGADLYRSRLVLDIVEDLPRIGVAAIVSTLTLLGLGAARGEAASGLLAAGLTIAVAFLLLVSFRQTVYVAIRACRRKGVIGHQVIVVGSGQIGQQIAVALLNKPEHGLIPIGMVDSDPHASARDLPVPMLGGLDRLPQAMVDLSVRDVIYAFPDRPDASTIDSVRQSVMADHQVFVVPRFFEMMDRDHHRRTEMIHGIALMRLRRWGWRRNSMFAKRALDVAVSGLALVLASPVLFLSALAVRLETGPGVIFKQTRVGRGGDTFTLYKFRSLKPVDESESAELWNIDVDSRLGPVGRFLRRTGLDELPQLVNILRGDMSLVGPRPERPHFVDRFSQEKARYADRHRVAAGLTGWAQVNDLRGDTSIDERVRFDNYYIENWSLWSDIKILMRTVPTLVRSEPGGGDAVAALAEAPVESRAV